MAGDNPYLEDWERIRHIAASISEQEERVRELQGQAYELEARIADLSYEPDDDGNDRNESARSYCYERLYGIQSEISYTEGLIAAARDDAHGMAGNFRQQAGEYGQRAVHTSNAGSGFESLEGFRFGASSAKAGAALARQRAGHYEDHAAALNELASAADQAAEGYFAGAGSSAIRERGEYRSQGPNISGGGESGIKDSPYLGRTGERKGGSGRNIAADAGLAWLGMKGVFNRDGGLEFSKVTHGSVSGKGGELSAGRADEALAAEWGITADMLREYRNENGLVWVNNQGMAELVPRSIAEEFGKGAILGELRNDNQIQMADVSRNTNFQEKIKSDIADNLIKNYHIKKVDFSDYDVEIAYSMEEAVKDAKKDFPDLDIKYIGSIDSQVAGIRKELIDFYSRMFLSIPNTGWSKEDIERAARHNADKYIDFVKLNDTKGVFAWSLTVPESGDPTGGGLSKYNGIAINKEYASDSAGFKKAKAREVAIKHKPLGCDTPRATMDHELGHEIDKLLDANCDPEIIGMYQKMMADGDAEEKLSGYSKTNIKEFIAECYSEYRNNPSPREYSRKVYQRLYDIYKLKKRKG